MPKKHSPLILRGSETENATWDLVPFKVGTSFWLPDKKNKNKPKPVYGKQIEIEVPFRVTPIILDLSRFAPTGIKLREYGAGEVTLAISSTLKLRLQLTKDNKDLEIKDTDRKVIVSHLIKIFQKATNIKFGVKIKVSCDETLSHMGLGTTPTLLSAVALGLNELCGSPLSHRTLCKLVSYNYGEESSQDNNFLIPGLTTGGAFWNCVYGGVNVVSGNFEQIFHSKLPDNLKILIGLPSIKEKQWAEKGFEIPIMDIVRKYDRFDGGKISHWVLMKLLPAIIDQDINKIGEVIWDITLNTAKAIPPIIRHGVFNVFDLIAELYINQVEIVFISSAGPAIVCMTQNNKKLDLIKGLFKKYQIKKTIITAINNQGVVIS